MTALNLRNAPRNEAGQLEGGRDYITSHDQSGNVTFHRVPEYHRDIRERIYIVVGKADGVVSRAQIAEALGLKKTPWLITAIEELVGDGYLRRVQTYWKNGVVMYYYEVNL